jgi:hypothetical protein
VRWPCWGLCEGREGAREIELNVSFGGRDDKVCEPCLLRTKWSTGMWGCETRGHKPISNISKDQFHPSAPSSWAGGGGDVLPTTHSDTVQERKHTIFHLETSKYCDMSKLRHTRVNGQEQGSSCHLSDGSVATR